MTIDINCDMGESWYGEIIGQDAAIMPFVSSCNLACGVHGGDPDTLVQTISLAIEQGVVIGAHPSLPDRANFGRENLDLPAQELLLLVINQVRYLQKELAKQGEKIHHLKPHGALYNLATVNEKEAVAVCKACVETGISKLYGPPGSKLEEQAKHFELTFVPEGFIDRVYANGLQLRSRKLPDSVIRHPAEAAQQALLLARDGVVVDYTGNKHAHLVKTLCLHGDHLEALEVIRAVRKLFAANEVEVSSIGS